MIIFHHNDLDGRASAASVRWLINPKDDEKRLLNVEMCYKDDFPFDMINPDEEVWIVDYSIPVCEMHKLLNITKNVTWIDHHKTAIENYEGTPCYHGVDLERLPGIRRSGTAACELVWEYLAEKIIGVPEAIKLIGDRDVWKWEYPKTAAFTAGMMVEDQDPNASIWGELLEHDDSVRFYDIIEQGHTILKFQVGQRKAIVDTHGFEAIFDGYEILAVNAGCPMVNSDLFGSKIGDYPFVMGFIFDGLIYTYHLYSSPRKLNIEQFDVSKIAAKYGGGGHLGAAGFTSVQLLLKKK